MLFRHKLFIPGLTAALVITAGIILYYFFGADLDPVRAIEQFSRHLSALAKLHPAYLILAITIAPAVGIPVSPLYILSGIAYGTQAGIIYSTIGVALNIALTYWVARRFLNKFIQRLLTRFNYKVPEVPKKHHWKMVVAVRIMPGVPLPVQNYILGLTAIPFWTYFTFSWIIQFLWVIGYVVTAGSIFKGHMKLALFGIAFMIGVAVILQLVRKRYVKLKKAQIEDDGE
ncbi:MAG: hypothetical protein COZ46_01970 [Verrucomicrobia bacterium CG_4_10_14_3_um_filter_43_23]|nr:MAG: hypothetical protein AUJ82_01985 [Verrucomicrobia bacterium CG1_02_43_26]PIP59686.1 MAG: hypothetical protein COX01_03575 [Verrucomicrobia bacterium CG22_combo_CG10-13_8_21_14_all_43_17]PIX58973.1 MAG: hypothetical protein COZ46_01970 [Verrucomicrobia bacterium CG_4_10_14_3_um_filter_43_23]PIY63123.1 MAG: hypothetical protein COY94_00320 [Verrucomicrobia bacterium CG_4_10_14_0_8_um_filter_43_34]PJA43630.1 MAG: hypothetical protein CO175_07245 [Verrucomicrobia bacterium CG_4_9_14_3_um_fi